MNRSDAWLALATVRELTGHLPGLLAMFGSPQAVTRAGPRALARQPGLSYEHACAACLALEEVDLPATKARMEAQGIGMVTIDEERYPRRLKEIEDAPPVLFARGESILHLERAVAVVGSRRSTAYGRNVARLLARHLSQAGVTVVSGLARGIDSIAHEAAMEGAGGTIAVLGCGLELVYPPENRRLTERIARRGSVVSEMWLDVPPLPHHFPLRNRIISGIADVTVVVEAAARSGALVTARLAQEQSRETGAVPGGVLSETSRGTNALIKDGAHLIECAEDVLSLMEFQASSESGTPRPVLLAGDDVGVLEAVGWEGGSIDSLIAVTGLTPGALLAALSRLEMAGLVEPLAGQRFVRVS